MMQMIAWTMIIGAAVAIIIAGSAWIMNIYAQQGEYSTLQIMPASHIDHHNSILHLELKNSGTVAAVIYSIEIQGVERVSVNITVRPGETVVEDIPLSGEYRPGQYYIVYLYTESGSVLKYQYKIPSI